MPIKKINFPPIRFSSQKRKKIYDEIHYNDLSQIYLFKKKNKKYNLIKNNKYGFDKNFFTKESENDFSNNNNTNNLMKKYILNESDSHLYLPLDLNKYNSFMNKSNNKGNIHNIYLNNIAHVDNKNNIENIFIYEYKKLANKKYTNHLYKDSLRLNNELIIFLE